MLYPSFIDLIKFKHQKSKVAAPSRRAALSLASGNHRSPFRGQGLEFDSVREYVPGDDIRNIDWRVTARSGTAHLKLFKQDKEREVMLVIDMNSGMRFGTKNTFKSVQAAKISALLGWQALGRQDKVSACLFGDLPGGMRLFPAKKTSLAFSAVLKNFTIPFNENHRISLEEALKQVYRSAQAGSVLYVISDFLNLRLNNTSLNHVIGKLCKKCDVIFISINDRADKSIDPIGIIQFCENDGKKVMINTEAPAGKAAYENLWKENRNALYDISSKFKVPLIELSTESDIYKDLNLGLKSLARRKK